MADHRGPVLAIAAAAVVVIAGVVAYVALTTAPRSPASPGPSGVAACPASGGTGGNWTTYHGGDTRAGTVATGTVTSVRATWESSLALDGQVYAQPLVCGDDVFVATEDDSVYAVNATNGTVVWHTHLGTPVPGDTLPCGDIDPSGITSTPVIDVATGTLYVVAFLATGPEHVLFGLSVTNGTVRSQVPVDPPGVSPTVEQQRGALGLANGYVYVPFGGLFGDCGQYHGFVEGAPVAGGSVLSYQVPTQREGAIWGPAGMAIASNGSLYVATGNGASNSASDFDFGDSVIELSPSLHEIDYFAPANWVYLNENDLDLGSVAPTLLPNGTVFEIGKEGVGYVLDAAHLGGIGGQLGERAVCPGAGAYAGTAHVGDEILVACTSGIYALDVGASNFTTVWQSASFDAGSPIVTDNVVWVVNISTSDLLGLSFANGTLLYTLPLGASDHFVSPAATPDSVIVAGGSRLFSFSLGF